MTRGFDNSPPFLKSSLGVRYDRRLFERPKLGLSKDEIDAYLASLPDVRAKAERLGKEREPPAAAGFEAASATESFEQVVVRPSGRREADGSFLIQIGLGNVLAPETPVIVHALARSSYVEPLPVVEGSADRAVRVLLSPEQALEDEMVSLSVSVGGMSLYNDVVPLNRFPGGGGSGSGM